MLFTQAEFGPRWDAIIVGAGIAGLGAAWALSKAGLRRVLVLERNVVGGGASSRGTGSVHVQRWTETDVRLIQRSKLLMADIAHQVGAVFQFNQVGRMTLVPAADVARMEEFARMFARCGVDIETMSEARLCQVVPGMRTDDVGLATYTRHDGCVYPGGLTWSLAGLVRQAGVLVLEGVDVQRLRLEGGVVRGVEVGHPEPILLEAPLVIAAAGAWSSLLLAGSGLHLPLQQIHTSTVVAMVEDAAGCDPVPSFLDAVQGGYSYIPRNPGTLVLAGGATEDAVPPGEEQTEPTPPPRPGPHRQAVFDSLNRCALHRFPGWRFGPVLGGWTGVLDSTPDANPLAGHYPGVEGLHVACGLSGYGVMRGMALGEAVARGALEQPALQGGVEQPGPVDVSGFAPARFGDLGAAFRVSWAGYNPFSSLAEAE